MNAIMIEVATFKTLSPSAQTEIETALGLRTVQSAPDSAALSAPTAEPADLSVAQVRKFVAGTSEKTTKALRAIAEHGPRFNHSLILQAVGANEFGQVRGVLAGLTKRTRTILGDPQADLVWWGPSSYDADGNYADAEGWVSAHTHRSLRAHFSL